MSIYYELRLKDIVLDLSTRPDLLTWFKLEENDKLFLDRSLPKELNEVPTHISTHNIFQDGLDKYFNFDNPKEVSINLCMGNKNYDEELTMFIKMIAPYIVSGELLLWDEIKVRLINYKEMINTSISEGLICSELPDERLYSKTDGYPREELDYELLLYEGID